MLRKINEMFHVDEEGYLVKTSNGQRIPDDEPVFILRGRDVLAEFGIREYYRMMGATDCDNERLVQVAAVVEKFQVFKCMNPLRMKQPGITKGK